MHPFLLLFFVILKMAGLSRFQYASNVAHATDAFSMYENTNATSTGYTHGPWGKKKIQSSILNYIFECAKNSPEMFLKDIIDDAVIKYGVPSSTIWSWHNMFRKNGELPCETRAAYNKMKKKAGFRCTLHGNTKWTRRALLKFKKFLLSKPRFFLMSSSS